MVHRFLLLLLFLVLIDRSIGQDGTCSVNSTSAVRFSLTSTQNETRHRKFQAELRGNVPSEGEPPAPIGVLVDHWTEKCDDREIVAMNVTLEVPKIPDNTTSISSISNINRGVNRRPRRLDYCMLVGNMGAYKIHKRAKSWKEAKQICKDEQSHLVTLDSEKEFEHLVDMLRHVGQSWSHITVWVGVYRENDSEMWKNVKGHLLGKLEFVKWGSSWPSEDGNCGALRVYLVQKKIKYLADANCNNPLFFLCEQDL